QPGRLRAGRRHRPAQLPQGMTRDDDEGFIGGGEHALKRAVDFQRIGKRAAGQVALVHPVAADFLDAVGLAAPQHHAAAAAGELDGKRGAPGTRAEHCERGAQDQASPACGCCCRLCWYSRSKFTGCSTSCGKPPLTDRLTISSRAKGNRFCGQRMPRIWWRSWSLKPAMVKLPACCTSISMATLSSCFASTSS